MTSPRPTWRSELPEGWAKLALALLADRGITADQYQNKIVKERLLDAMAVPNIMALLEHGRRFAGVDDDEAAGRLVLDRGTLNRWLRDAVQPHARMFFGLLVMGLRKEIDEVELPGIKQIIWESVSRTMAIIREKELGLGRKRPSREEFTLVRWVMRHPDADSLIPGPDDAMRARIHINYGVISDAINAASEALPHGRMASVPDALSAILNWAETYALFRLGLLWEWSSLDEDAA